MATAIQGLSLIFLSLVGCTAGTVTPAAKAARWPEVTSEALAGDVVFAGTLVRLHESACVPSGVAVSSQAITLAVTHTFKGELSGSEVTVHYVILGSGPLEVHDNDCYQLSPRLLKPGARLILAASYRPWVVEGGGLAVVGGPWIDIAQNRMAVEQLLTPRATSSDVKR